MSWDEGVGDGVGGMVQWYYVMVGAQETLSFFGGDS